MTLSDSETTQEFGSTLYAKRRPKRADRHGCYCESSISHQSPRCRCRGVEGRRDIFRARAPAIADVPDLRDRHQPRLLLKRIAARSETKAFPRQGANRANARLAKIKRPSIGCSRLRGSTTSRSRP